MAHPTIHLSLIFFATTLCHDAKAETETFPTPPPQFFVVEEDPFGTEMYGLNLRSWVPMFDRLSEEYGQKPCVRFYYMASDKTYDVLFRSYRDQLGPDWVENPKFSDIKIDPNANLSLTDTSTQAKIDGAALITTHSVLWTKEGGSFEKDYYFGVVGFDALDAPENILGVNVLTNLTGCK